MDFEIKEAEALAAGYDRQGNPVGFWDCGATMSAGSAQLLQPVFDEAMEVFDGNVGLKESLVRFTFAGGEQSEAQSCLDLPLSVLSGESLSLHPVPNPHTPILLGLDNLRAFGMVLDFDKDSAFSKKLGRFLPTVRLNGGHLGLALTGQPVAAPSPQ